MHFFIGQVNVISVKIRCYLYIVFSLLYVQFYSTDLFKCIIKFQYNFVGRILGPRGMTAKQLEQETGCKIMVRGKGSMRDKKKVIINLMRNI